MRRDWNQVRRVLQAVEDAPWGRSISPDDVPGMEAAEARSYFAMLAEAGLAKGDPAVYPDRLMGLSWAGHDLAEILRKEGFFSQIKDEAKRRGVALTLDAIGQIARMLIAGGGA
ncbi:MAG: DUF2513 domain-containing protein [Pseudomonadota bacterium]